MELINFQCPQVMPFLYMLYSHNKGVRLAHATYLILHKRDISNISTLIHRGMRLEPIVTLEYMYFCIDHYRSAIVSASDGGAEEISVRINRAKESQEECKKNIKLFWNNILTEYDLGSLGNVVMNIVKHELIAERIYKKV